MKINNNDNNNKAVKNKNIKTEDNIEKNSIESTEPSDADNQKKNRLLNFIDNNCNKKCDSDNSNVLNCESTTKLIIKDDQCIICKYKLCFGKISRIVCRHKFCTLCITKWANILNNCPICY
jgi:hypothetical protein